MAKISRFDVRFRSKRELSQCLGLKSARAQDLTEEAIAERLGTEDRLALHDFLSERLKVFKMGKVLRKLESK